MLMDVAKLFLFLFFVILCVYSNIFDLRLYSWKTWS